MDKVTAQVGTILKVFVSTLLALMITNGASVLEMSSWNDWKPYVAAGIAAVIVWGYNYLNPVEKRYGVGAE